MSPQGYYEEDERLPPQMPFMSPQQQYGSSIIQMTNPEGELLKMELTLRGMKANSDGEPIKAGDPLLNEEGINSVVGQVQAIVSQTTIMSNFDKGEIPNLVDFLGDTLAKDLMVNRKRYEISTTAARDRIYYIALISAYICLKRAFEQGERGFWGKVQQEMTQRIEGGQQPGILSKIMGWGKH